MSTLGILVVGLGVAAGGGVIAALATPVEDGPPARERSAAVVAALAAAIGALVYAGLSARDGRALAATGSRPLARPPARIPAVAMTPDYAARALEVLDAITADAHTRRSPELLTFALQTRAAIALATRGAIGREELLGLVDAAHGRLGPLGDDVRVGDIRTLLRRSPPPPERPEPIPPPEPGECQAPGTEHVAQLRGPATKKTGAPHADQALEGDRAHGPSRRETIEAAARQGFATRGYQAVYADYAEVVEEVMHQEQVPSTHRYYVGAYFQAIRPE